MWPAYAAGRGPERHTAGPSGVAEVRHDTNQVFPGFDVVGLELERHLEMPRGLVDLAEVSVQHAEVIDRLGESGLEPDRAAELPPGLGIATPAVRHGP